MKMSRQAMMPLVLGGLLGAGVALLTAPRSGQETRAKLKASAKDLKHKTTTGLASTKQRINHKVEQAKGMKQRVAEAVSAGREQLKTEMADLRHEPGSSRVHKSM